MALFIVTSVEAASKRACYVNSVDVSWKAYKTAAKIGVGGVFDTVVYTPSKKGGETLSQILVGSSVVIDTKSVNSNNKGRDDKLFAFFFQKMTGEKIEANIVSLDSQTSTLVVEIKMNGVTKNAPMKYSYVDGEFNAEGVIDILDFNAGSALGSINKACYDLHKGKTWSDVSIAFSSKME